MNCLSDFAPRPRPTREQVPLSRDRATPRELLCCYLDGSGRTPGYTQSDREPHQYPISVRQTVDRLSSENLVLQGVRAPGSTCQ